MVEVKDVLNLVVKQVLEETPTAAFCMAEISDVLNLIAKQVRLIILRDVGLTVEVIDVLNQVVNQAPDTNMTAGASFMEVVSDVLNLVVK